MPNRKPTSIQGVMTTSLRLPTSVHEDVLIVRAMRSELEKGDVKIWRLYREAIEYWLAARPQRQLLEQYRENHKEPVYAAS